MSLKSLVATGTKLWLDSVDPDLIDQNIQLGATGARSISSRPSRPLIMISHRLAMLSSSSFSGSSMNFRTRGGIRRSPVPNQISA